MICPKKQYTRKLHFSYTKKLTFLSTCSFALGKYSDPEDYIIFYLINQNFLQKKNSCFVSYIETDEMYWNSLKKKNKIKTELNMRKHSHIS